MSRTSMFVGFVLFLLGFGALTASDLLLRPGSQSTTDWRDPSPHHVRTITVDSSVRLEVLDWGGSGRPVVLLGCYLTAHVYDDFAPKLTDRLHVYGITRRGIGASDKPPEGYSVQRSAADVLEVLDSLKLHKPILVASSCGGWVLTVLGAEHSDRLGGLVYLQGTEDPTMTPADYNLPAVDVAHLPASIKPPPAADYSSFAAYRASQQRDAGVAFPEAELRQLFVAKPDGSVGPSLLSPMVRSAITVGARVKPDFARIRVPVLAIYKTEPPFEELVRERPPRNEQEQAALRQQAAADRAMLSRWERDLLAGVPTARIVELEGANLYMFLSNEADVLREVRAFAAGLRER
jgi:non-heme chloroperoxidase